MRQIWRLLLLAGVAVVAFAAALVTFEQDAEQGCAVEPEANSAYAVELQSAPSTEETTYRLAVTRQGQPVTEARVCVNVDMGGMSAMGVSDEAREVAPGVYEVSLRFAMAGPWDGTVLVDGRTDGPIAIPLSFEVR